MNPISAFFVQHIIGVYFLYGLAFFVLGLVLALTRRQTSEFKFAQAIWPLAIFGILHGTHEWFEMFQKIAAQTCGYVPGMPEEVVRLTLLGMSFVMLLAFGAVLLAPEKVKGWRRYGPIFGLMGVWLLGVMLVAAILRPTPTEMLSLTDVLIRYILAIPGAAIGAWALMAQQHAFRERDMPQFGRDLVWSAAALLLYGVVGQLFIQQTMLPPSTVINSSLFLSWFGIPVQLFRGIMAAVLTFYIVRVLRIFELENRRRFEEANQAKLLAQTTALEAEQRSSREMEHLNEELRLATHELSLLLDLSNLLATPLSLGNRLHNILHKITQSLHFIDAGLILLVKRETNVLYAQASTGFDVTDGVDDDEDPRIVTALELGELSVAKGVAICKHSDGENVEFMLNEALDSQLCRLYQSPMVMISLPLTAQQQVIGSIVLARPPNQERRLTFEEFKLILGIAQELGFSIENARLQEEAQQREKMLGELLNQVVGAQEAERQRIARELHDATGQSLTAIALGLRGVEMMLADDRPDVAKQIKEIKLFGTNALGELRQFIADLRPPQLDDLGLVAALQWYIRNFENHHAIQVDFVLEGEQIRLLSEYETVLFRITQEALINIAKHARATQATVNLEMYPTRICVTITDNGCGFNPEEVLGGKVKYTGWGLMGIRERALLLGGQYKIDSTFGNGTQVQVCIPLMVEMKNVENTVVAG